MSTQQYMQKGISMPLVIGAIAAVVVVLGGAYFFSQQSTEQVGEQEETEATDTEITAETAQPAQDIMAINYEYSGGLPDVTEGKTIRGITTGGNASGIAKANYSEGMYDLFVTFENLPDPQGTDFYEGWVVRRGESFNVISTGKVEKTGGTYTNTYSSAEDLTDHDFYVLTIEPDDGDPAPADHIVEGELRK